jgi:hypothetical protein
MIVDIPTQVNQTVHAGSPLRTDVGNGIWSDVGTHLIVFDEAVAADLNPVRLVSIPSGLRPASRLFTSRR